jgi:hypothetical protein
MAQWVALYGNDHITNYIHIIGSGHMTYFARKYGNFYRYSQQGWESLNQLLKHYYFNNTNHGGSNGNGGKDANGEYMNGTVIGNHCKPLMKLCQRTIMWKLGLGDAYFDSKYSTDYKDSVSSNTESSSTVAVSATQQDYDSDEDDYNAWNVV